MKKYENWINLDRGRGGKRISNQWITYWKIIEYMNIRIYGYIDIWICNLNFMNYLTNMINYRADKQRNNNLINNQMKKRPSLLIEMVKELTNQVQY